jgi:hypothetical protein
MPSKILVPGTSVGRTPAVGECAVVDQIDRPDEQQGREDLTEWRAHVRVSILIERIQEPAQLSRVGLEWLDPQARLLMLQRALPLHTGSRSGGHLDLGRGRLLLGRVLREVVRAEVSRAQ